MNGENSFLLTVERKDLNRIRDLFDHVLIKNEYLALDQTDFLIVKTLEAFNLYLNEQGLESYFEVLIKEKE